jgi:hypothetical protein
MMDNYPSGYNEQPSLDDLLQPYEMRIKELEDFIKKARSEVVFECNEFGGEDYCVVPYWFMTDEIV